MRSNDYSLVVRVQHGDNSFLFAGDAEDTRLTELIEQGNLEHTFLNKKTEEEKVMTALEQWGTKVYVTRNGNVYVTSDGNEVTIKQ